MPDQAVEHELLIFEGPVEVRYDDIVKTLKSRVTLNVARVADLQIKTVESADLTPTAFHMIEKTYQVRLKPQSPLIEVLAISTPIHFGEEGSGVNFHFTPRQSPVFLDGTSPLASVTFGIVNLGRFMTPAAGGGLSKDRIKLESKDWTLEIAPISEGNLGDVSQCEDPAHRLTHSARLTRPDQGEFSCDLAHDFLHSLCLLLSFARGRWVAVALVKGLDREGSMVMEEWGSRQIEPYTEAATWLDRVHGETLIEVFPGFLKKINDPAWSETIRTAIYWYTRTNGMPAGPDGSIVLIQAALERLSWEVLVQQERCLSSGGFAKLPAADQLRLLLDYADLPLTIPQGLEELKKKAKGWNWTDGAQAFVEIRNSIVHPPKGKEARAEAPIYQACLLGQWYLELVLLRLFDFKGKYSNRTAKTRYVGQIEPVPWANK